MDKNTVADVILWGKKLGPSFGMQKENLEFLNMFLSS